MYLIENYILSYISVLYEPFLRKVLKVNLSFM